MSAIVQMTSTVGEYASGNTYRLRTREAQVIVANAQGTLLDQQPEPAATIEGE